MDPERKPEEHQPEQDDRPAEAELATVSAPETELAVVYAAWRLDRREDQR